MIAAPINARLSRVRQLPRHQTVMRQTRESANAAIIFGGFLSAPARAQSTDVSTDDADIMKKAKWEVMDADQRARHFRIQPTDARQAFEGEAAQHRLRRG